MLDAKKCIEIYDYCQKQWFRLIKKEGHYNPKHDKRVFEMAAKEFKLSEAIVNKIYEIVLKAMPKNTVADNRVVFDERKIRNLLYSNMLV